MRCEFQDEIGRCGEWLWLHSDQLAQQLSCIAGYRCSSEVIQNTWCDRRRECRETPSNLEDESELSVSQRRNRDPWEESPCLHL